MNIDLLRHGECHGGTVYRGCTDDPLTETGWQQMRDAIATERNWSVVVSSPLGRCAEFAQATAVELGVGHIIDPRLREINFGDWEGMGVDAVLEKDGPRLRAFWQDPVLTSPPNGERIVDMQKRVLEAWGDIVRDYSHCLIVSHGGPIRVILGFERNIAVDGLLGISVPHAARFTLHESRLYPTTIEPRHVVD